MSGIGGGCGDGDWLRFGGELVVACTACDEPSLDLPIFSKWDLRDETGLKDEPSGPSGPLDSMMKRGGVYKTTRYVPSCSHGITDCKKVS